MTEKHWLPCPNNKQEIINDLCRKRNISPGKIELWESYGITEAEIRGLWRPKIVLPAEDYSDEELSVILQHELSHYLQKDLWLKRLGLLALILNYFNPIVWLLQVKIRVWSEYACDEKSALLCGGTKHYFDNILKIVTQRSSTHSLFSSHLYENDHELLERLKHMTNISKNKKRSACTALVLCTLMILANTLSVMAAATGVGTGFRNFYLNTATVIEEEYTPMAYEEELVSQIDPELTVVEGEVTPYASREANGASISWTVPANTRIQTPSFPCNSGDVITISFSINPFNASVDAGIILPSGAYRKITGSTAIGYSFSITQAGYYRVFVDNKNSYSVTVNGGYDIQ